MNSDGVLSVNNMLSQVPENLSAKHFPTFQHKLASFPQFQSFTIMIGTAAAFTLVLFLWVLWALVDDQSMYRRIRGSGAGRKMSQTSLSDPKGLSLPVTDADADCSKLAPCGSFENNVRCVTFYPKRFWEGLDEKFQTALETHVIHKPKNTFYETEMLVWKKELHTNVREKSQNDTEECLEKIPESLVYWHNFKAGGTSVRRFLTGSRSIPHYEVDKKIFQTDIKGGGSKKRENLKQIVGIEKDRYYHRQVAHNETVAGFTFVRPPVERFFSSVAQLERMGATKFQTEDAYNCFRIEDDVDAKIGCIVDSMLESQVFFNAHVYPQAYLMESWTNHNKYDSAITVADLKDLHTVVEGIQLKPIPSQNARTSKKGEKASLSDLTSTTLEKICRLYEVDVLLLEALGMTETTCRPLLNELNKQNSHNSRQHQ